jgi:hypothetical protein
VVEKIVVRVVIVASFADKPIRVPVIPSKDPALQGCHRLARDK